MTPDTYGALQAVISSVIGPTDGAASTKGPRYTVAISRDYGCGGDEIGRLLAKRLGVPFFSKEIIEKISERAHVDRSVVKAMDEAVEKARDLWLFSMVTGQDASRDTYKQHLVNVALSLGRYGGVIMGRGAHIILAHTRALRVRITGTLDVCAKRVADEEKLSLDAARKIVQDHNHERGKFVWEMFGLRQSEATLFDLVLNTDRLGDREHLVEMLAQAAMSVTVGEA